MPNVKTAISLEPNLLFQVGELATSMNVSRSRVFALAVEEFVKRRRSEQLTQQLNDAYAEGLDEQEQELLRRMRPIHQRLSEGEW
jgi:predicted transcriptional regulator